jgi:A/G-specific adenine glycosylase
MKQIPSKKKIAFQKKILSYYTTEGRHDLPWRQTTNRYHVLVSEIMLQQTQVNRVIEKYTRWIQTFPTSESLANASLSQVLSAWSGLGYNSRGKRLQESAKIIVEKYKGIVPNNPEELLTLPGIGPYTARSVLIFADNAPLATVDTNIRRILIHEFNLPETISDKELFSLAEEVVPKNKSRDWHNALMDYGATLLTSKATGIKPKTKQSAFKDSKRYYRGQIIKVLTTEKKLSLAQAKKLFPDCKHDLKEIFETLRNEGLLEKNKNNYHIKT